MARFWLRFGDREVALPDGEIIVGRGAGCHVRLVAPAVSRRHLRLLTVAEAVMAYDLGSRNGTWINGKRLSNPVKLRDGDTIRVGTQSFGIREAVDVPETEEEPDTWDMVIEQSQRSDRLPPSSYRSTIEMDRSALLNADHERRSELSPFETGSFSVGLQECAVCGRDFELGQPFCPYCMSEPYSEPRYRTCTGCKTLLSESDTVCPKCGLARQPLVADDQVVEERRREDRHSTEIHGLYVSSSLTFEADVKNLSRGGLFIVAELLDPVGTAADIVLTTEGLGRVRFSGEVAHVVDEAHPATGQVPGMGIRFVDITPKSKSWLEEFLRTHTY